MATTTLDLTCPCGATLRLVSAWYGDASKERAAFDAAHADCRQAAASVLDQTAHDRGYHEALAHVRAGVRAICDPEPIAVPLPCPTCTKGP